MRYEFTEGAQRALREAQRWSIGGDRNELTGPALLLGLAAESECRAALILGRHGIDTAAVRARWPALSLRAEDRPPESELSPGVREALAAASQRLRGYPQPLVLATEQVLLGVALATSEEGCWLRERGLDPVALEAEIHRVYGHQPGCLPLEPAAPQADFAHQAVAPASLHTASCEPPDQSQDTFVGRSPTVAEGGPAQQMGIVRALDAAANRAREGFRVVEDYARFVLDDGHLTGQLKGLRHDLAAALDWLPMGRRLAARETQADVGTGLTGRGETTRQSPADVLTANFLRVQEALRSIEELGKLHVPGLAAAAKQLRYRAYTLQRAVQITAASIRRLAAARLCVLVDGGDSSEGFDLLVRSLLSSGVHLIQLRDKRLADRELLARARRLRELTAGTSTLILVNDRPDLAALALADGVHVGQEDMPVKDARAIVGPDALVGVSTHCVEQARQAVLDGADYIGVGPVFPSGTKQFDEFPGLGLVRAVAAEIGLPAFAIGGITRENLPEVLSAGLARVAVSGAVTRAEDPGAAARGLMAALESRARLIKEGARSD